MIRTLIIAAIAGLLIAGALSAATFTGTVLDAATGQPLERATIRAEGSTRTAMTGSDGTFRLTMPDTDTALVSVTHVGFAPLQSVLLIAGEPATLRLTPSVSMLDNVVVTASRYEKLAYEVPQPVTAASRAEIETKGHTIVSDIMRTFPGTDMNDAGPFRARPIIRGLYGTRVLVLVDGERLNDQRDVTSFAGVSMSLIDVNEIERVEVVNGPSSVLYGSDAMAGVVNVITRERQFSPQLQPIGRYSGRYSTADQQHSNRFDLGFSAPQITATVGFSHRQAEKNFAPPDDWNRTAGIYSVFRPEFYDSLNAANGTAFDRDRMVNSKASVSNFDTRLAFKPGDRHRLDLDIGVFRGSDIGYPGVPNDSTPYWFFYPEHNRDNVSLKYTGDGLTNRMTRLESRIYYQKISKDFLTDFFGEVVSAGQPFPASRVALLSSLNRTEVTKFGWNFQELYTLNRTTHLTFGLDLMREEIDGFSTSRTRLSGFNPGVGFTDTTIQVDTGSPVPENTWHSLGLYLSGDHQFRTATVIAGARFDNFWVKTEQTDGYVDDQGERLPTADDHYAAMNGSLGLIYPVGRGVNLVTNVGTAYRVPNVVERFYFGSASGRQTRPNIDIKPERSVTVDFGVKAVHGYINYSLIGFHSTYSNLTQLQRFDSTAGHGGSFTSLWRYENVEDVSISGLETMIEGTFDNGLYGTLSLSYQYGQDRTNDKPLFVSPIKTTLTMGYRLNKRDAFGELTIRQTGDQNRVAEVSTLDDIPTEGYTILNLSAGIRLYQHVRLALTVNNLFDKVYSEPFNARNPDNPIAEPGRNLIVSVSSTL
jgi:hemoglobin/transferrin/lactoferrin receptor protein